jgi:tetratricopeptide (TPR) repeat protein
MLLEGEILQAEGRLEEAAEVFTLLAAQGKREGITRLATIQMIEGETEAALATLDGWLATHKDDPTVALLRADALMRKSDHVGAIAQYEALSHLDDPLVLNNLAWLYMEQRDQRAIEVAERAQSHAPENADISDTLGWILVQFGQAERGIRYLRESIQQNPDSATVRYHLGIAYLETGNTPAGRAALEEAINMGPFPEREEALRRLAEVDF